MVIDSILAQLKAERSRLDQAIIALEGSKQSTRRTTNNRSRRRLTAAGRKRLSKMMKKRWAERKRRGKSSLG